MLLRTVFSLESLPARSVPARALLAAAALLTLAAMATTAHSAEVEKRATDDRTYRAFTLDNGLRAVVVSDPQTDQAAAALDVNVGNGSDPAGREGLAHFLEHMLFLGTAKYPQAGEYKDFMTVNGGGDNAYTSYDHTNYFFYIDQSNLEPALDRFAQFFIEPLFNPEYVARERQVVHSEYTSRLQSDARRVYYAGKQAMNPAHPGAHFAVGDLKSLGDREGSIIRDELIAFYKKHYSAGIMAIAVVGREPVAQLEQWVRDKFSAVPNTGAPRQSTTEPLYTPGTLPLRVDIVPVKDRRSVSFSFVTPPVRPHYRTKPTRYISDLLGHEGQGSLLSALKARGWAEGLSAGAGFSDHNTATLKISIQLTASGLAQVEQVGSMLFAYLELVRASDLEPWRYEELSRLADIGFAYGDKEPAARYVRRLANDLHLYETPELLRGPYMMSGFDADLTKTFLDRLTPDNVVMTVVAPGLDTDTRTDKFDVALRKTPIDAGTLERWRAPHPQLIGALSLPGPNEFIPERLALADASAASAKPTRIAKGKGFELWHHLDTTFGLPRNNFYVSIRSSEANRTARHAALVQLFVSLVNDQLTEFSYPAYLAGMEYDLYPHVRGFSLRLKGYSDKQERILTRIVGAIGEPRFDEARFATLKTELARRLANSLKSSPYERAYSRVRDLMMSPQWSEQATLDELATVSLDELRTFSRTLLAEVDIVALAHGNVNEAKSRSLGAIVAKTLAEPAKAVKVPSARIVDLPPGANHLERMSTEQNDSATLVYLQGEAKSFEARARMHVLAQFVEAPFFDELRTRKQLGYVVFANSMSMLEVPALALLVQSPIASAPELRGHIDEFMGAYTHKLAELEAEALEDNKNAVLSRLLERDTQLDERTNRYWNEIDRGYFEFDLRERFAAAVRSITLDDFKRFCAATFGGEAGRLVIEVNGAAAAGRDNQQADQDLDKLTRIGDSQQFKDASQYFPG